MTKILCNCANIEEVEASPHSCKEGNRVPNTCKVFPMLAHQFDFQMKMSWKKTIKKKKNCMLGTKKKIKTIRINV